MVTTALDDTAIVVVDTLYCLCQVSSLWIVLVNGCVLCCRFVKSNAYLKFLERGGKLKYNEFGTARPALESLPVIAAGVLGVGQGKCVVWQLQPWCVHATRLFMQRVC